MKTLESKKIKLYSEEDGQYYAIDALHGESAFEIAQRLGFKGSEQEWMDRYVTEIETDGEEWLNKINTAGTNNANYIQEVVDEAEKQANAAKQNAAAANTAAQAANSAATTANEKANLANEKANLADEKASLAGTNATKAATNAALAGTNATLAQQAADAAITAATNANEKAGLADEKATLAKEKADAAAAAAITANEKAGLANEKATRAQQAADLANAAESAATSAATSATTAADAANKAAGRVDTAINSATNAAGAANLAASEANNAISGLPEKVSEGIEQRIGQITDALTPGNEYAAELVSARTDEDGQIHDSLKTRIDHNAKELRDTKADAIRDTSAKAASHELYAQDAPLHVTLHGATHQAGSGDPSPDNVRPISGVDAALVHVGGKNLLNVQGEYTYTYGDTSYVEILSADDVMRLAKLIDGKRCAISFELVTNDVVFATSGKKRIGIEAKITNTKTGVVDYDIGLWAKSDQVPATGQYKVIATPTISLVSGYDKAEPLVVFYQGITAGTVTIKNLQIVIGDTATEYEPYNANVIDLPLLPNGKPLMEGDTVENDVPSGCDELFELNGSENWTVGGTGRLGVSGLQIKLPDVTQGDTNAKAIAYSNRYVAVSASDTYNKKTGFALYIGVDGTISAYVYDPDYSTADKIEEWKARLAANPLKAYYRSTEYTPEKDIRVCKVTRRTAIMQRDGREDESYSVTDVGDGKSYFIFALSNLKAVESNYSAVPSLHCNYLPVNSAANTAKGIQSLSADVNERMRLAIDGVTAIDGEGSLREYLSTKPLDIVYELATPEIYYTDPYELRKPYSVAPVTVTGSGATEVSYACDTAEYIKTSNDRISALEDSVSKALPTDTSLTQSNKAADAKIVGDKLMKVESDASSLKDTKAPAIEVEASGSIITVDDAAAMNVRGLVSTIKPAQAAGTPTPEKPLPISGWDSVHAMRTGKNLLDMSFAEFNDSLYAHSFGEDIPAVKTFFNKIKSLSGKTVMYSADVTGTPSGVPIGQFRLFDAAGNVLHIMQPGDVSNIPNLIDKNISFMIIYGSGNGGSISNIQFELGRTATPYEPYQAQTLTAALPETVYGGELDWKTGVLTVDHKLLTLDGTETWNAEQKQSTTKAYFWIKIGSIWEKVSYESLCDRYTYVRIATSTTDIGFMVVSTESRNATCLYVRPDLSVYPDVESWKAYLAEQAAAGTPMQVCYRHTQPTTYQLTPQQLETLKGYNNVWSDCGDTSLVYVTDTNLYVEKVKDRTSALESTVSKALPTDTSLTLSGKAADAKIVGDKLTKVESDASSLKDTKVDRDGVGEVSFYNIDGFENSGNIFSQAKLLGAGKYPSNSGGKLNLANNSGYNTYIIPCEVSQYIVNWMRFWCVVGADKETIIDGVHNGNVTEKEIIDVTADGYLVLAIAAAQVEIGNAVINKGTTYNPAEAWKAPKLLGEPMTLTQSKSTAEDVLNFKTAVKKGVMVSYTAKFDTFESLRIGFSADSDYETNGLKWFEITSAGIITHTAGADDATAAHGLTITDFIAVTIEFDGEVMKANVTSVNGSYLVKTLWNNIHYVPFAVCTGENVTENKLSIVFADSNKPIYLFGDSYVSINAPERWAYYLDYKGNCLIDGYSGERGYIAIEDFKNLLTLGKPKYAVWCLGMNDLGDVDGVLSARWMGSITEFLTVCKNNNITPILATVPSVPTIYHEIKNDWVRNSGHRYIDFAKAVGASPDGTWYAGMLSGDGVHPTVNGAKALCARALVDFPEFAIE